MVRAKARSHGKGDGPVVTATPKPPKRRRAVPRGTGSVYQRAADARWVAAVNLPSGKRRVLYADTEDTALELFWKARGELDTLAAGGDRLTVAQWLDRWYAETVKPRRAFHTRDNYQRVIRLHLAPTLGAIRLQRLSARDVQVLLAAKLAAGLKPSTVRTIHAILRAALDQAERWGLVSRNAADMADPVPVPRRPEPDVRPERIVALLEGMRDHRHGNLFALILATGLRHSEALGLRWADVDWKAEAIRVSGQLLVAEGAERIVPLKGNARPKLVSLMPFAVEALRREKQAQAGRRLRAGEWADPFGLVFTADQGRPLRRQVTGGHWRALLEAQGLERLRLHDLRHAVASLLLAVGASPRVVADWLGHANPTITLNVYAHAVDGQQREAAARLWRLLEAARGDGLLHDPLQSPAETATYQEGQG